MALTEEKKRSSSFAHEIREDQQQPQGPLPRITFENFLGQGRINQLGGVFINGRPLPHEKRLQIVEMARQGVKPCKISRELKVSHGAVSKILMRFNETGSISPGQIGGNPRSRISIQAVRPHILRICSEQPGIGAAQIQQMLVQRGICSRQNVPSGSRINRLLKAQKQKTFTTKLADGSSEREGAVGGSRPLSHSIENILGEQQHQPPQQPQQAEIPVDGQCSSSSSSALSTNPWLTNSNVVIPFSAGSDEENQQQQQQGRPSPTILEGRRARTSFSQEQLRLLEQTFSKNPYPGQAQKERLVKATGLDEDKVITWFSNRRARSRRKAFQHCPPLQQLFLPSPMAVAAAGLLEQQQKHFPNVAILPEHQAIPFAADQDQQKAHQLEGATLFGSATAPPLFPAMLPSLPAAGALFPMLFPPQISIFGLSTATNCNETWEFTG